MLLRLLAPGSQPRKWSNDRFSIISTTTCSMLFEPCGDSAAAALAAVWDKNSAPVRAAPVEAPTSWRKVRRVSMKASMRSASNARQAQRATHSCLIRLAVAAWFPAGCLPVGELTTGVGVLGLHRLAQGRHRGRVRPLLPPAW